MNHSSLRIDVSVSPVLASGLADLYIVCNTKMSTVEARGLSSAAKDQERERSSKVDSIDTSGTPCPPATHQLCESPLAL